MASNPPGVGPAKLTLDEMLSILATADITVDMYQTVRDYHNFALLMIDKSLVVAEEQYAALTAAVNPKATATARAHHLNEARIQAETLAKNLTQTELKGVGETIAKGLEEGLGPKQIAARLNDVSGLDSVSAKSVENFREKLVTQGMEPAEVEKRVAAYRKKKLRERKKRIARTEAANATAIARESEAVGRGAQFKVWNTSNDKLVSDECISNAIAGAIPISATFPGGVTRPTQHPNCRCNLSYFTSEKVAGKQGVKATAKGEKLAADKEQAKAA
ncbi:hypothetical protein LCGC14_1012580 [marine sediment metagenome]|uniref:Phage head morphogenesis domain-containing protein n=1 Tax=marine sediment metagenome TaxID=412755 RepID=A0A0F9R5Y9_9ZZZZ